MACPSVKNITKIGTNRKSMSRNEREKYNMVLEKAGCTMNFREYGRTSRE